MHSEAMATRDTVGAMQQVWVCPNNTPRSRLARFLRLSALHATTPPPCNIPFPQMLHQSTHAALWHLLLVCSGSGLSLCRTGGDTHLVWLQGSDGVWSSKEIVVGTPRLSVLQR